MKPATRAVLALLAAAAAVGPARALDEASEAAARFGDKWNSGVDSMKPEEADAHRAALLEPLAASGSAAALDRLLSVAEQETDHLEKWRQRLKDLDERDRAKAEAEKSGEKPKGNLERGAAEAAFEEERKAKEDREKLPGRLAREERWLPRLADAAGPLVDGIADAEFQKVAAPRLREALRARVEGWDAWMARALGGSRKARTARLLLEAAEAALAEYRKCFKDMQKPAQRLGEVNKEIAERQSKYLEKNPGAEGIPSGLILNLKNEADALDAQVRELAQKVESANGTRNAARAAVGRMLSGAPDEVRESLLAFVQREVLAAGDFETRCFGIATLGPCPGDRAMALLREASKDPNADVVVAALDAIAVRSEAEALDLLVAALGDGRWQVRAAAAAGLATLGRAAAVPPLVAALAKAEARGIDDLGAALRKLTGQKLPAVAAAWEEWWAKAGAGFRGAKDPGGAAPGEGGEGGAPTDGGGNRVSFYGIESRSDRVIFILDFSGSMNFPGSESVKNRKKIDILYEQMRQTITGLPDGTKFNIVAFSHDVRLWKKAAAVRDAKVAKEAVDWVEKQKVEGATNIYDALDTAFKLVGVGASGDKNYQPNYDTIFFMTDGVPTAGRIRDKSAILGEVKRWNEGRRLKLHVVGMGGKENKGGGGGRGHSGQRGDDIDKDFLEKLAKQNGGDVVFR